MKVSGQRRKTWQKVLVVTLLSIVALIAVGSTVLALLFPNATGVIDFLAVPTLAPMPP